MPASHNGLDWCGFEVVGDYFESGSRGVGYEDSDALRSGWGFEAPTHRVAGEGGAANEGNAAEAGALKFGVGYAYAVDPKATVGVNEILEVSHLDLITVEFFEKFFVAGELPFDVAYAGASVTALSGAGTSVRAARLRWAAALIGEETWAPIGAKV